MSASSHAWQKPAQSRPVRFKAAAGTAVSVLVLLAGCSTTGPGGPGPEPDSGPRWVNARMLSAGVLRLDSIHGRHLADLTIERMSALDVLTTSLPRCAVTAVGRHPRFLDLNWHAVRDSTSLPVVHLTAITPQGTILTAVDPDGGCHQVRSFPLEAVPAGEGQQLALQLLAPASNRPLRALHLEIAGASGRLPLVPDCGRRVQPRTLICTVDPVTYDPRSPYSVSVREPG